MISYKAQAACYLFGILIIIQYILEPFGVYLVDVARLTWFPSTTLFFASLVLMAFQSDDTKSLDHKHNS